MKHKPRIKKRVLSERVYALMSEIERHFEKDQIGFQQIEKSTEDILASFSSNNPKTEGSYTGPISTWIEHHDIDESRVEITNIKGGKVTVKFEERVWSGWSTVHPNGQNASEGGKIDSYREVNSDLYDGDHRLKISCDNTVTYHLKFTSKDR